MSGDAEFLAGARARLQQLKSLRDAGHLDAATFDKASAADLSKPDVIADTMAFMFETRLVIRPTRQALDAPQRQSAYQDCWKGLRKHFQPPRA